jgi:hypothetical protein
VADDIEFDFNDHQSNWPGYSGRVSESSIETGHILLNMTENAIDEIVQEWLVKGI